MIIDQYRVRSSVKGRSSATGQAGDIDFAIISSANTRRSRRRPA